MDISKKYCHLVVEDTYVVWLEGAHRFIQLKEPAFYVFEQWASGQDPHTITITCRERYELPAKEAARFVGEIVGEMEKLDFQHEETKTQINFKHKDTKTSSHFFSQIDCDFNGKKLSFRYGDEVIEEVFRPLFEQFEQIKAKAEVEVKKKKVEVEDKVKNQNEAKTKAKAKISGETGSSIELFAGKGEWCIGINGAEVQSFPEEDWEHFHGAVYTELLSLLHGKKLEEWMGIFHAAAVVDYRSQITDYRYLVTESSEVSAQTSPKSGALMFVGESGSGKSTVAAILMAHGYRVLTDDFLPVGMPENEVKAEVEAKICGKTQIEDGNEKKVKVEIRRLEGQNIRISEFSKVEVKSEDEMESGYSLANTPLLYPLPAAISVKKHAIPILASWFSELKEEAIFAAEEENYETYLPLSGNAGDLSPIPAKAIFFIKYDPTVDFCLTRESNLAMMNDFLKQSWIANNATAAQAFLEWYFALPVYSLVYSDAKKLVKGITLLE